MNLPDKHIGQTILFVSALFFFSCQEDSNLQGYKAKEQFNVLYKEIPVETSVYLADSLITTNFSLQADVSRRFLVGQYNDPKFGLVSATTYAQYWTSTLRDSLNFATYDSISLHLSFDFNYTYGSQAVTPQEIAVYELDDTLTRTNAYPKYYNTSSIKTKPSPLGSKTFTINPAVFKDYAVTAGSIPVVTRLALNKELGKRLFESARKLENATVPTANEDSTYVRYLSFMKEFKGISIASVQGDKIVSFNPSDPTNSKIVVHFHNSTTNKRDSLLLTFQSLTSFNRITSNRSSSSELSGLTQTYQPLPATNKLYYQSGTGVTTKLDFKKFLEFSDTIPDMIINSAELVVDGVETDGFDPPLGFMLWILKDNNRFKTFSADEAESKEEVEQVLLYNNDPNNKSNPNNSAITVYNNFPLQGYSIKSDIEFQSQPTGNSLFYSAEDKKYTGFITLFLEALHQKKPGKINYFKFGLYALSPAAGKSVNRVSFNSVKLRIYYTRSLNNNQ